MAAITSALTSPLCSVCIANYNGIGVIDACIDSVLAQGWGDRVEIIIHDDASTDSSAKLIREHYPAVRLLVSDVNVGFCVANNRMVQAASGQYVLLLNNDAELMDRALETLFSASQASAKPAILTLPQYDAATSRLLDIGSLLDPFLNPVPNLDPQREEVGMVMGACLWIPKTLWDELGGFPEWFGSIGEDLYLCCLARLWGYPVRAIGNSGYKHHVGKSFGGGKIRSGKLTSTFRRRALSERNKTFVMALTYPAPFMQLTLPVHLMVLLAEGAMLSIMHRRLRYLTVIYLPVVTALLKKIRIIQRLRSNAMAKRHIARTSFFKHFDWLPYKLRMLFRHGLPKLD